MKNLIKQIKISELFFNIDINDLQDILNKIDYRVINLVKKQYVFDTLTSSNYIGVILSGKVNIEKILPSGKSVFMYSKKKGDVFGEVAAFSETDHYPCNVISKTESSLILFHKSEFFKMLMLNPQIFNNFLKLICNKTFSLNNRVAILSFTSARERIVYSILNNFTIDNNMSIKLPFSKQRWSNTLNISRASLYRELNNLCELSLISFHCDTIKILNLKELEEMLNL